MGLKLLPNPSYSPDLNSIDGLLFSDFKRMFPGEKFNDSEEVITETEIYFEAKNASCYKNCIEKSKVAISHS